MSLIIMLILLSFLIIIHELGHFLAARAFNIKVDKFGFGLPIGPTLYKTKWGETEVLIHAFLLGGYISFPDDNEENDLPLDSDERFKNKPIYQKTIVIAAGVFFNILCAFFFIFLSSLIWNKLPSGTVNVIVSKIVAPKEASVWTSGLREKDRIYSVNGVKTNTLGSINMFAFYSRLFDGQTTEKAVNNKIKELKKLNKITDENFVFGINSKIILPQSEDEAPITLTYYQLIGLEKYKPKEIKLSKEQEELRDLFYDKKEVVLASPTNLKDIATAISDTRKPMFLEVERDHKILPLKPIYSDEHGLIGIERIPIENYIVNKNLLDVFKNSSYYLYINTKMMLVGLEKLFTGQVPLNDLHGIVAITKIGTDIIEESGMFKGFLLTAIISLNLAIVNLLPIPALDGGHLLFLLIEKIQGRPVSEKVIEKISTVCFNLLIVLMFYIIFNDIFALITKKI